MRPRSAFLGMSIIAAMSGPLAAQEPVQSEQVESKLQRETDALKGQGFAAADKIIVEPMGRTETRRYVLRLAQNVTYAMIAGCGDDCQHVEITIFDSERQQLSRSTKRSNVAIFSGAPDRAGLYEVEITQPGCRQATCQAGFAVLQQGGAVPKDGLIIAASRPQATVIAAQMKVPVPIAPAKAQPQTIAAAAALPTTPVQPPAPKAAPAEPEKPEKVVQKKPLAKTDEPKAWAPGGAAKVEGSPPRQVNMERRADTEIPGNNYRRLTNTSLQACERLCVTDQRCRAVEFYKENQSCGLFDYSPSLRRAFGIDASVKRIAVR